MPLLFIILAVWFVFHILWKIHRMEILLKRIYLIQLGIPVTKEEIDKVESKVK